LIDVISIRRRRRDQCAFGVNLNKIKDFSPPLADRNDKEHFSEVSISYAMNTEHKQKDCF